MLQVTVSDEQARMISEASTPIVIVDTKGRALGQITPVDQETAVQPAISAEELAEIKRRMEMPGPGYTTQEVLDHLQSLGRE